mmetsp:Transcript_96803/g.172213  ORF Transcript_96803/g.172213 Transcript_96803/m.172213 type:complete len:459 (-) Transcript_96803:42-1418(-)|eukprot:CAMPEP_0197657196 /NCGR_PEP_ID=MMETSP1338-20131121/44479_1 /TAXON_ID=43686 ORGANISM="Pelagodinium beii, Strain RCC1491" /NCGR_SAMPLE_ID=MMETSP1338 /ASSEMBLY_ACC=CAM_ASM_000754 /LENGTH=458 /DNA_ID=CAMNT_0043233513 /DNA_START=40 /DNA_END=1416 /DNA_ORIENTATION=+
MSSHELVQRVKEWQRLSSGHKAAWDKYCRDSGSSKFDPSKKEDDFLQGFLDAAESGGVSVEEQGGDGDGDEKTYLVNQVKQWQRKGEAYKLAWWDWCKKQGTQDYDPNRHEPWFLEQFIGATQSGEISVRPPVKGGGYKGGRGEFDDGYAAGLRAAQQKGSAPYKGGSTGKGKSYDGGKGGYDGGKGKNGKGGGYSAGGNGEKIGEIRFDDPDDAQVAVDHLSGSMMADGSTISVELDPNSSDGTKLVVKGVAPSCQWQELKDHFKDIGVVAYAGFKESGGYEPAPRGYAASERGGSYGGGAYGGGSYTERVGGKGGGAKDGYGKDGYGKGGKDSYGKGGGAKDGYGKGGGGGGKGVRDGGEKQGEIRYDDPQHAQDAVDQLNGSELDGRMITVDFDPNEMSGMGTKLVVGNCSPNLQWQELKDHFKSMGTVAYAGFKDGYGPAKGKGRPKGKSWGPY